MSSLAEVETYVDPTVMAHAKKAQEMAETGDNKGASRELQLAQDMFVADLALLPVEDAYARVRAAQAVLNDGKPEAAQRLLGGVPLLMTRLQVKQPLLGVRVKLSGASEAAKAGNWQQAHAL